MAIENGAVPQQVQIDPQEVINSLMGRVQQLVMELAMKDAYIAQLQSQDARSREEVK